MMHVRRRGSLVAVAILWSAAVASGLACTDVSSAPGRAVSVAFDSLPYPSVVTGDSLRDSTGKVAPLHPLAFNTAGAVLSNAVFQFVPLDTGLTISATGLVAAQASGGSVRVVALVDGLQSVTRTIDIVRRPDSVIVTGKSVDTLRYALPDNPSTNITSGVALRLATRDTTGGVTSTKSWLVSFQAFYNGAALARSDTSVASIWSDAGNVVSTVDTTGADGTVSRRLRIRPQGLRAANDSVIVIATVRYRGAAVRGSPVRFVILTRPK
jgi:hypothetical protein